MAAITDRHFPGNDCLFTLHPTGALQQAILCRFECTCLEKTCSEIWGHIIDVSVKLGLVSSQTTLRAASAKARAQNTSHLPASILTDNFSVDPQHAFRRLRGSWQRVAVIAGATSEGKLHLCLTF